MSKRILFIDDEDWSVSPYFEFLQDHKIEIDLAEDGDQAIEFLQKKAYDLIVLDIMFTPGTVLREVEPRQAGSVLLYKIRHDEFPDLQIKSDVPVLVLTAVTDQKQLDNIRKMGIKELCRKPVSFEEVLDTVSHMLGVESGLEN
jgi:DNA-binding response OmpR family regulator